jgi:putative NADH-flavin reductase
MNEQMTVFGASGRVGRRVVAEALSRGYTVVAFVHGKTDLKESDQLKVVRGDIYNAEDVDRALAGSTAVVSALGSWGTPKKDILTAGMTNIIPAMRRRRIVTIVSLTGADARAQDDHLSFIHRVMHFFLLFAVRGILVDGEQHIDLLERSGLEWTVIRSPVMIANDKATERYSLSMTRPMPWRTVAYQSVALAMVNAVQDRTWERRAPYIK